jgi:hypothetical protein
MSIFHVRVASVAQPRLVDVTLEGITGNASAFVDAYLYRTTLPQSATAGVCNSEVTGAYVLYRMCLGDAQFVCLTSTASSLPHTSREVEQFFLDLRRLLDGTTLPPPLTHEQLLRQPLVLHAAHKMPDSFVNMEQQVRALMLAYNKRANVSDEKVDAIQSQLHQVRNQMGQSIDLVLERGTRIDTIVESSSNLADHAIQFHTRARLLRRAACWNKWKATIGCTCMVIIIGYICASAACGTANIARC